MNASKIVLLTTSFLLIGLGLFLKTTNQTVKTADSGSIAGSQVNLLASIAPDLPLFPEARITSFLQKADGVEITLETDSRPDEVQHFYDRVLKENGWEGAGPSYFKEGKQLDLQIVQNYTQTQTAILLNYVLVPTK